MAKSRMVLLGLGILLVCFCLIRTTVATGGAQPEKKASPATVAAKDDEDCRAKESDQGEECRQDDQDLGLYDDVDETFRVLSTSNLAVKVDPQDTQTDVDDTTDPLDSGHNTVVVLGH
ncbi:hypothetical protein L6164_029072 [Bauhinia variegata]|uniref:Uncharacterized protein n=1 Tax=Bauhinia variegata TaxID=167791 RepID=A0ACB9L836_BAUVA|nr:hypothetical protein L6164_029072 [Bauhinia variegata]